MLGGSTYSELNQTEAFVTELFGEKQWTHRQLQGWPGKIFIKELGKAHIEQDWGF